MKCLNENIEKKGYNIIIFMWKYKEFLPCYNQIPACNNNNNNNKNNNNDDDDK